MDTATSRRKTTFPTAAATMNMTSINFANDQKPKYILTYRELLQENAALQSRVAELERTLTSRRPLLARIRASLAESLLASARHLLGQQENPPQTAAAVPITPFPAHLPARSALAVPSISPALREPRSAPAAKPATRARKNTPSTLLPLARAA